MSFEVQKCLAKATSRAKSDVANKLVSMLLHEVSRKVCSRLEFSVGDPAYSESVATIFGPVCCYCGMPLETNIAVVEHPDGMNRIRAGLHIPGNALLACRKCNNEKRRDDQAESLVLAVTGWESFLSHDGSRCDGGCKTCEYWERKISDAAERSNRMAESRQRIAEFRRTNVRFLEVADRLRPALLARLNHLYRECQDFATKRIRSTAESVFLEIPEESF
jgi:hypothetical protein